MDIGEITWNAIKYPISDWKKILILGIIIVFSGIASIFMMISTKNIIVICILSVIGFLFAFLAKGYEFRIVKSSLADITELPEFNAWIDMFITGIKVYVVGIVYLIPVLIIGIFALLSFGPSLGNIVLNPSAVNMDILLNIGILALIAILYAIIIFPILLMAIANMAHNGSKFSTAFKFSAIFNKISNIGLGNLIIWYIVTGIIYLILITMGGFISILLDLINPIVEHVLTMLIITSYIWIYLSRSVALAYKSGNP